MPRRIFSFDSPDRFICGAVGQPGQRTFFLQAAKGGQIVSVALEKAQVAVLAERLATLLLALRQRGLDLGDDAPTGVPMLSEPIVEQFRAGMLTLGWDADAQRVVIEAREVGDDEDEEEDVEEEEAEPEAAGLLQQAAALAGGDADDAGAVVRVRLDPEAALEFASGALAVVQAGRPPCPMCGEPLDPTGHFCARRNGYTH